MKKNIFILIFVLFLLAVSATAAKDIYITSLPQEGGNYDMEYPKIQVFQLSKDIQFNFHVFNYTGVPINQSLTCFLDIYNKTGHEIVEIEVYDATGQWDYTFNVGGGNFSYVGDYYLIAACYNLTQEEGGFISSPFFITEDGTIKENLDTTTGISIVIFILAISGSLFLLSMKKDLLKNQYANIIARRSLLVLGIYIMILNSAIMATLAASSNLPLVQEMFFYMNVLGYLGYPAMILLMLSALLQSFKDMKQNKKNKRTGEEDG